MRYWDDGHMDTGWAVLMVISMILFWALVAVAIVWVVRSLRSSSPPPTPPGGTAGPEQILAERLARGEIDPDEYQTRLTALRSAR